MLKKIYSKNKEDKDVLKIEYNSFKDLMINIIPGSKIKWKYEKRKYTCIARSDNFIIFTRPFNLKKNVVQYTIFDLKRMKCNHDNLVFGIYDYSKLEDCKKALEALESQLLYDEVNHDNIDDYPELYKKYSESDFEHRKMLVKKANTGTISDEELLEYCNFPMVFFNDYAQLKDTLQISERGPANIEDIVEEIWVEARRVNK